MVGCTVIARNYLAQASVLVDSFQAHHPGATFSALVIDAEAGVTVPYDPRLNLVTPSEAGVDPRELHRMAGIYSVLELACAMKPYAVRHALGRAHEPVVYVDSDVQVFAPLDEFAARASEVDVVLTPHLERPPPRDPHGVDVETVVLQSGVYNTGVFAAGPTAGNFLDWWAERLARDCVVAPAAARMADQRWVDLAPHYFAMESSSDPGINLAWWNVAGRHVDRGADGEPRVDGRPLRAFHFSGHDPDRPHILSTHAGASPSVLLSAEPVLRELCAEWDARLAQAGHAQYQRISYGFSVLPGGMPYDARMRALYREALLASERDGRPEPPIPFEPAETEAFVDWLREPIGGENATMAPSRYLRRVHEDSPELRTRFADLDGTDAVPFLRWCATGGGERGQIPFELLPQAIDDAGPSETELAITAGVQIISAAAPGGAPADPIAPLLHSACARAGDAVRTVALRPRGVPGRADGSPPRYDVNLFAAGLLDQPGANHQIGHALRRGRHAVGVWRWDLDRLPANAGASLEMVDEVWTWSEHAARAFAAITDRPVIVLPLGILDVPSPVGARTRLRLDQGPLVQAAVDLAEGSGVEDGPAVVEAYRRAFATDDGVSLALIVANPDKDVHELERIRAAASGRPDVRILKEVSARMADGLLAESDCVVWMRRSAGMALEPARAMAAGRPVVAVAHSAALELMDDTTALLVPPAGSAPVGPGHAPLPEDASWAVPDLDGLAAAMRRAIDGPEAAKALGARARARASRLRPEGTAAAIARRLGEIRAARARPQPEPPPGPSAVVRSARWLNDGPTVPWDSPASAPERAARSALLRAMRPYLERRGEFDVALVQAAEESAGRLSTVEARLDAAETEARTVRADVRQEMAALLARLEATEAIAQRVERLRRRADEIEIALGALAPEVQRALRELGRVDESGAAS